MPPETVNRMSVPTVSPVASSDYEPIVRDFGPRRGRRWVSNLGWAIAALGFLVLAYAYYWQAANDDVFVLAGVAGTYVGAALVLGGLVLAVFFLFMPVMGHDGPRASFERTVWVERARHSRRSWLVHRRLSWMGPAIVVAGFGFIAWLYRANALAGSDLDAFRLDGASASYGRWAVVGLAVALIGLALWLVSSLQMGVHRLAVDAYVTAARVHMALPDEVRTPAGPAKEPAPAAPPPAVAPGVASAPAVAGGVPEPEIRALMRRLDQMMASLPEETVAAFSNSPEAATYLRLLGDPKARP